MVRNIMGTLLEVGTGKRAITDISKLLEAKDRRLAGKAAPPQGLFLRGRRVGRRVKGQIGDFRRH